MTLNIYRFGNTQLTITRLIEAGWNYVVYLDQSGIRRVRFK